jgi:uncharacterized coiled-coil DUF342 family protein
MPSTEEVFARLHAYIDRVHEERVRLRQERDRYRASYEGAVAAAKHLEDQVGCRDVEIQRLVEYIVELRDALEQVRRTDYVSNHLCCTCYICKALGAKERNAPVV